MRGNLLSSCETFDLLKGSCCFMEEVILSPHSLVPHMI